jgi:hypothetical protein
MDERRDNYQLTKNDNDDSSHVKGLFFRLTFSRIILPFFEFVCNQLEQGSYPFSFSSLFHTLSSPKGNNNREAFSSLVFLRPWAIIAKKKSVVFSMLYELRIIVFRLIIPSVFNSSDHNI